MTRREKERKLEKNKKKTGTYRKERHRNTGTMKRERNR